MSTSKNLQCSYIDLFCLTSTNLTLNSFPNATEKCISIESKWYQFHIKYNVARFCHNMLRPTCFLWNRKYTRHPIGMIYILNNDLVLHISDPKWQDVIPRVSLFRHVPFFSPNIRCFCHLQKALCDIWIQLLWKLHKSLNSNIR